MRHHVFIIRGDIKLENKKWIKFEQYKKQKALILKGKRKLPNGTIRKALRPLLRFCLWGQRKIEGFSVKKLNVMEVPKSPVIFALTHIGKWDFEIISEQIKEQSFVIASDFIHMHGTLSGFFLNLNGIIYVDEGDKQDKANTKEIMIKLLQSGENVMIFPEGDWNLYEAEIIRDIAYGTADVAVQTNAAIIPIAAEQYDKSFVINFGQPLQPQNYHKDKRALTLALRDMMATLKWEIWEKKGVFNRIEIPDDYWDDFIYQRRKEWSGYSMNEQMQTFIPKEKREYWALQEDLKTDCLPKWYQILLLREKDEFL